MRRLEAQLFLGQSRVRSQVWDIAASRSPKIKSGHPARKERRVNSPPPDELMSILESSRLLHRFQDLQHAEAPTPSKVISLIPRLPRSVLEDLRMVRESVESEEMARGEIEDVKVVTNTGAVTVCARHIRISVLSKSMEWHGRRE